MLEVEAKYRVADWSAITHTLETWGAMPDEPREDVDQYFNAPDRDFARTDEAVRLRRIGTRNVLTYKGPKRDPATKTRTEIEVPVADGPEAAELAARFLTSLGYRPVATVAKRRQVYRFTRHGFAIEASLDDAGPVGRFVELEIQAEESRFDAARAALLQTAAELGFSKLERRSYLEMWLTRSS